MQLCSDGFSAWDILKTKAPYDVLIVNHNVPKVSGLELVLRVRSMAHRRNLPIIMLSDDDVEKEAWRAGVDAFLRTSEAAKKLTATLFRILEENQEGSKKS